MPVAEHKAENKLSTRDSTPLKPLLAVGGHPDPQRDQPLGSANATATASRLGKPVGGEKSAAAHRWEEGGEQTPAAQWLAGDQLSSSDLLFALQEELEAVEDIRVSLRLAREPRFMGLLLEMGIYALAELKLGGAVASPRGLLNNVFI